jgi:hypothetical protein
MMKSQNAQTPKHHWTEEEDQILRRCTKDGMTDGETANVLGLNELQIKGRRQKLGLMKRSGNKPSVNWTEDMLFKLESLFEAGKSDAEIGETLGISKSAAEYKRKQLGLYSYKRNMLPVVKPLNKPLLREGDVVKLKYKATPQSSGNNLYASLGAGSYMNFVKPLIFEGVVSGEGPGTDKHLFRSKAGWRVTFTLPQLQDYEVEVVS